MSDKNTIAEWYSTIAAHHLPRWNELPDIDLYLDQVLTLLDKYLVPFFSESLLQEHVITSSMINNYVKLKIIPAPVKKRYSRIHLAYLIIIGMLKQILPIPDIKKLLESQFESGSQESDFGDVFDRFCAMQEKAFSDMSDEVVRIESRLEHCAQLAMETAVLSNTRKLLAEKLIDSCTELPESQSPESDKRC